MQLRLHLIFGSQSKNHSFICVVVPHSWCAAPGEELELTIFLSPCSVFPVPDVFFLNQDYQLLLVVFLFLFTRSTLS
jgi:hypothetical protein